jgi:aspartate aminotransferase-like enzyme
MDSGIINLNTGPVLITAEVKQALIDTSITHRSNEFQNLYARTSEWLKKEYQVKYSFILTGSGTLANEVMLHQARSSGGKGLILSNGEFGERLIDQAHRLGLEFISHKLAWGELFNIDETDQLIQNHSISWIVFTHCETSTGVLNDLIGLTTVAKKHNCQCYIDCMSTIGTRPFSLAGATMATASSGKGFASMPGLAIVFSNVQPATSHHIPAYLDLGEYAMKKGVPFTLSSNQLNALFCSLKQKLHPPQYALVEIYRKKISDLLAAADLLPFDNGSSYVFTLVPPPDEYDRLLKAFRRAGLVVSFESDYLKKRKWIQLALFNFYTERELRSVMNKLEEIVVAVSRQYSLKNNC